MLGILIAGVSTALEEVTNSLGKRQISDGAESAYTFGFLTQFVSALLILGAGVALHHLTFSLDSLATFLPRAVVGILEIHLAIVALVKVDRGTIGFVRLATIPLLVGADLALGYTLSWEHLLGMACVVVPIAILFSRERSSTGFWIALVVAALAAIDISLYKYDVTHFNSVETEQALIALILAVYFFIGAVVVRHENPFRFLKKPVYVVQTGASGLAYLVGSFAYLSAPASVITAAFRGFSVLFSILTGRFYFREQHFLTRVCLFLVVASGLALLI